MESHDVLKCVPVNLKVTIIAVTKLAIVQHNFSPECITQTEPNSKFTNTSKLERRSKLENCVVLYSCPSDLSDNDCIGEFRQGSTFKNRAFVRSFSGRPLQIVNDGNINIHRIVVITNNSSLNATQQQKHNVTLYYTDGT